MTIFSKETKTCGCIVKKYIGGKIVLAKKCKKHKDEKTVVIECGVCGQRMSKREMKQNHRWTHAI